jgi:hypothetical protein
MQKTSCDKYLMHATPYQHDEFKWVWGKNTLWSSKLHHNNTSA